MTLTLVLKLLRDLRWSLLAVVLLLGTFQVLWAKVVERVLGRLSPFFLALANSAGLGREQVENIVFDGPAKIMRTVIGGEAISLDRAMDMLSIGYVHPLMQTIFCIWAVGRAAGAIAGEIDRGTMELLLAQPLARWRLILAHFLVDLIAIPILCLGLWAGNWIGAWAVGEIEVQMPEIKVERPPAKYLFEAGPFKLKLADPSALPGRALTQKDLDDMRERLAFHPMQFGRALVLVGGLIFAVAGYTMWLSSAGRSRVRVLGVAVLITLIQFLLNILGQMWDDAAWLRPFTVFYYYQPQQLILTGNWNVTLSEWNGGETLAAVPMPLVLYGVGAIGYVLAWWTLSRRDLPAPL